MILHNILDAIHDGVMVVDRDSKIIYANPAYTRNFGVPVGKVLGRKLVDIEPNSRVLEVLRSRKGIFDDPSHVVSVGIDIVANISPVFEGEEMVGAVAVFRDVSEIMALKDLATRYHHELKELRSRLLEMDEIVSDSPQMRQVLDLIMRVATVDSTVLITGESGVGKEMVAKLIHRVSERRNGPMIAINCGAIPENLLESELFGYEKGAFSGANREGKPGLLEIANLGTLFLDEVGDLPPNLQVKLLRVVEEQRFRRIGGVRPVTVNVRLLAATNRDLKSMVQQKSFREDLFYRLNVVALHIPPLRERNKDIARLVRVFLHKYNSKYKLDKRILPEVIRYFESNYHWPGNVRELENVVERLVVSSRHESIAQDDEVLVDYFGGQGTGESRVAYCGTMNLKQAREQVERELIQNAVRTYGSTRNAAKILGMDHSTVARKAKKYGINTG